MKNEEVVFENVKLRNDSMIELLQKTLEFNKQYENVLKNKLNELKKVYETLDKNG